MSASKAESCKNLHVTIHELVIQGESWYILVVYIDKEKLIRVKIDDFTVFYKFQLYKFQFGKKDKI